MLTQVFFDWRAVSNPRITGCVAGNVKIMVSGPPTMGAILGDASVPISDYDTKTGSKLRNHEKTVTQKRFSGDIRLLSSGGKAHSQKTARETRRVI